MKKYFRNETGYSYWIGNDSRNYLMAFGVNNDSYMRDITLYKKNYSSGSCQQECYDYSGEPFALIEKYNFNIKRIVVYQLGEKEGIFTRIKNMFS